MNHCRWHRPAYTLIELVLGMAVSSILLAGLGSAMVIASKAVPDRTSPLAATVDDAFVVEQIADELLVAQEFSVRTSTAVEFSLADRTNDGQPEVIRYEWSASAGAPLRRQFNGGTWVTLVDDVADFNLGYDLYVDTSAAPSGPTESAETLLSGHNAKTLLEDWTVTDKSWIGQYFWPSLPNDATSWKVTRVRVMAKVNGSNTGIDKVQLQKADATNKPTGAVIDQTNLLERELTDGYLWHDMSFKNAGGLAPGAGVCLLITWISGTDAGDFQYQQSNATGVDSNLLTTSNGGGIWTSNKQQSMIFEVYGTYSAPSITQPSPPTYVTGVRIRLRTGASTASTVESRIAILNEPKIGGT